MPGTLPDLFSAAVRRDGASPFLTYYDDVSGERIELSALTTANWVAKTANLLVDELDLASGETVAIGLPPHWLGVVWALSTWSAGAAVTTGRGDVAITGPDPRDPGARPARPGRPGNRRERTAAARRPVPRPAARRRARLRRRGLQPPGRV